MKVYKHKNNIYLDNGDKTVCLGVDIRNPTLVTAQNIEQVPAGLAGKDVCIVYGIYVLLSGPYIAVVTKSKDMMHEGIHRILKLELMAIASSARKGLTVSEMKDEERYIKMIQSVMNGNGNTFYYSKQCNLTLSKQKAAKAQGNIWTDGDERFFWNRKVVQDFVNSEVLESFAVPVINGYVNWQTGCMIENDAVDIIFITRRSCRRVGTRFCVRGTDKRGHVANFAESEIILKKGDGSLISYTQIRGSIPVYWDQVPTLKYMPRTRYAYHGSNSVMDWNKEAFALHFEKQISHYGKVTVVNLVDKIGKGNTIADQYTLGNAFSKYAKRFGTSMLRFEWFDFHHECRKLKWHNLSKLLAQINDDFTIQGCFRTDTDGHAIETQKGVFRVNCMDNLDRTNVVQSLFARRALLLALAVNTTESSFNVLDSPYPSFEKAFKNVWADNADAVSIMYAGTGALKTDFTRTGKRTIRGAIQDGVNSVIRYYKNNFTDGYRQDCLDLFVANYTPDIRIASPFTFQHRHALLCCIAQLGLLYFILLSILGSTISSPSQFQRHSLILVVYLLNGYLVLKKGFYSNITRHLVCKPVLCINGYPES